MASAIRNVLSWVRKGKPDLFIGIKKSTDDSLTIVDLMKHTGYCPKPDMFAASYEPRDHSPNTLLDHCRTYMNAEILDDFRVFMSEKYRIPTESPVKPKRGKKSDFDYIDPWTAKPEDLPGEELVYSPAELKHIVPMIDTVMKELSETKIEDLPEAGTPKKKVRKRRVLLDEIHPILEADETVTEDMLAEKASEEPKPPKVREADTSTLNEDWGGW